MSSFSSHFVQKRKHKQTNTFLFFLFQLSDPFFAPIVRSICFLPFLNKVHRQCPFLQALKDRKEKGKRYKKCTDCCTLNRFRRDALFISYVKGMLVVYNGLRFMWTHKDQTEAHL